MQYLKQILTGKPQPDDNDDNVSKCGTEFEVSESFYIYIYTYIFIYVFLFAGFSIILRVFWCLSTLCVVLDHLL